MTGAEVVSLKEHFEKLLDAHEGRYAEQIRHIEDLLAAHEKVHAAHDQAHSRDHDQTKSALDAAAEALKEKLITMNEFRGQITDERGTYATKDDLLGAMREMKAENARTGERVEGNAKRLDLIERRDSNLDGKLAVIGGMAVLLPIVVTVGLWVLTP